MRWRIYLAVFIVMLGLAIAIYGSMTKEKVNFVGSEEAGRGALTLSVYYKKGQKLGFGLSPGEGWEYFLDTSDEFKVGGQYINTVPVTVLIRTSAAPDKNVTLEVEYSDVGSQGLKTLLDVFIIKVLSKSDILKMETSIENWTSSDGKINTSEYLNERKPQLGIGTVQYDGDYQIEIVAVNYIKPPPSPPNNIILYIYDVEKVMDCWYLIPLGLLLIATGGFMLIRGRGIQKRERIKFYKKRKPQSFYLKRQLLR
jgi:hypothetical protein